MSEGPVETAVLLHGFGGTRRGWDAVTRLLRGERYRPVTLDLPGHGASGDMRPIGFASCAAHVLAALPPGCTLAGYSLGGRVALHVALAAPQRVRRLVLISTTAGIEDPAARAARRDDDERLALELERGDYERFIERWRRQPLFADDPPAVAAAAAADQRRNRPGDLAAVLRGVGVGQMAPLWDRLGELRMPTTVVVGARDMRYQRIGRRLEGALVHGALRIVAGGHTLLHENPAAVAEALRAESSVSREPQARRSR